MIASDLLPRRRRVSLTGLLLAGAVAAGVMYFVDPDSGRGRRARVRERAIRLARKSGGAPQSDVPDEILVERVRAKLGVVVSHSHPVAVRAENGVVTLAGPVLRRQARPLIRATRRVRGVHDVIDQLERHELAENLPALRSEARHPRKPELVRTTWPPGPRLLVGVAGGLFFALGMRWRGLLGTTSAGLGATLITRAVTNLPIKRLIGVGTGPRAIEFAKSIHIGLPPHEVFSFFRDFRNLPRFMSHLEAVEVDGQHSHWKAIGPAGVHVSWHAEITRMLDDELIAWRSIEGSRIRNAGVARFMPDPRGGTILNVHMAYNPPAGAVGSVVASVFGADPKKALDEDLLRLKTLLEEGQASAHARRVSRHDIH